MSLTKRAVGLLALALGAALVLGVTAGAGFRTPVQPYAIGFNGYETEALWSVGETVPETSDPSKQYQMVGIPDGLGAHAGPGQNRTLFMNHELTNTSLSRTTIGEPRNRGAVVSKVVLGPDGDIISAERAYDEVYLENTFVGPAPTEANTVRGFGRFCSGSIAGPSEGFDSWIYFANEESAAPATFSPLGGLAVAIVDNKAYALPKLGHFRWENTLVQPNQQDNRTVIMGLEDGPAALDASVENSQVYMYVGTKVRPSSSVLRRNGLDNGTLYVLAPVNPSQSSEAVFRNGSIPVQWVEIPNAENLSEPQLEAASDARNAFRFARPEDGAFNKRNPNHFVFVTTGGATANALGRIYSFNFQRGNPLRGTLTVEVNGDAEIAAGGDTAISPDNIDFSHNYLMVNEDATAESRVVMIDKGRDGSIWRFNVNHNSIRSHNPRRVGEVDTPGRDGIPVPVGNWETSGIIDTSHLYGRDTWLFDVQAHAPTTPQGESTVEDGQLLLLRPDRGRHDN
jgi:hypothetical protein